MKTKLKFSNRILSLVLALVMVLGMMPIMSLTAYAATYNDDVYVLEVNSFESYWNYNGELSNSTQIDDIVDVDISVDANNQIVCSFKMKYKDSIGQPMTSTGYYTFTVENKSCTEAISYDFVASYNPSGGFHYKAEGKLTREARTEHTGGQNTCVAGAVCSVCGETYGTVDASAHNWGDWTYSEDGKHIRTCTLNSAHTESGNCDHKPASCLAASACSDCGHTYEAQKSHSYTYSADGNTITESCNNGCGHSETAKLEYATGNGTYSYTGSAIKPLKVTYSSGWQGGTLDITYQNNTAVSTDTSKASGSIAKGTATATQSFTITKATMSGISVNGYSGVYDGEEHGISITNVPADATVSYSTSENGAYTTTNPTYTEKGTYEVWYKIEKENYETVSGSASVVISQATNDWITDPSIAGWTYGETAKTPSVAAQFGTVKVEYRLATETDADYTTDVPTEAGSYLVRFSVEGNENYTSLTEVVELKIAQVKLTVTADDKSKTYGENDPALTWQITEGKLVGTEELESISISRTEGNDADSYAIIVSQTEGANPNYDITFEGGTFTINQKEIGISWGGVNFLTYTGQLVLPKVTATGLVDGDTCEVIVSVVETTEGAGINPGKWTARITGLSNENYKIPENLNPLEVKYTIYASQSAPDVSGVSETIKGKNDGYISGLTTEMEYAIEPTNLNSAYTKITDPNMIFTPGTYYVRYAAKDYYYFSPFTEVTVAEGRELTVTLPSANEQIGYTIEADKASLPYKAPVSITIESEEGYSRTEDFTVYNNGVDVTSSFNFATSTLFLANVTEDVKITIADGSYVDTAEPTAEIKIENNKWTSLWNNLTFGLFFKETQDVTITATDKGSGVKSIQYYLSNRELELDEVRAITEWQTYNDTFKIDPENRYVIYAKVADNSGNTVYLNSAGIVLDATAPSVYGIEDGGVYYGDKIFKAMDDNFLKIEVDGVDITDTTEGDDEFKIVADNAEHTVTVTDKAGNVTEYKITVYKNYTVTFKADGVTVDTQTVGYGKDANAPTIPTKDGYTQTAPTWDKDGKNITADTEINAVYTINKYTVTYKADGEVVGSVTVEHGKDATAPAIPEKEGYTQTAPTWDKDGKNITADIEINAVYTINKYTVTYKADGEVVDTATVEHGGDVEAPAVPVKSGYVGKWDAVGKDITKDTTISAVYTAILDVKADEVKPEDKTELEDAKKQLEDMLDDDSYTEDDKKDIQEAIEGINDALKVIENVEAVEELIGKLPENITKNDEDAIKAADDAYNALTDYEKSLVDADAKKALDDAKTALAELNKPADPNSPNTGDNSNMFLWIALLFISGGAVITLTVVDRKRRNVANK